MEQPTLTLPRRTVARRMLLPFVNDRGGLRNGWWILAFYLALGASLIGWSSVAGAAQAPTVNLQLALILALTGLFQLLRRESLSAISGSPDRRWAAELLLGALAGSVLMALPALLLMAAGEVSFGVNPQGLPGLVNALGGIVAAAVLEELVFRGFMFRRLLDGLGLWPTLLITSAFFVLTHLGNPHMEGGVKLLAGLNIFIASIAFGLALARTGSLAMPIGLHVMANLVQGPVLGFGVSGNEQAGLLTPDLADAPAWVTGGSFGLEASLPGLVVLVLLTGLLLAWRGRQAASGAPPSPA